MARTGEDTRERRCGNVRRQLGKAPSSPPFVVTFTTLVRAVNVLFGRDALGAMWTPAERRGGGGDATEASYTDTTQGTQRGDKVTRSAPFNL